MKIEVIESSSLVTISPQNMPEGCIGKVTGGAGWDCDSEEYNSFYLLRSTCNELIRIWPHTGECQSVEIENCPKDWKVQLLPKGTKILFSL